MKEFNDQSTEAHSGLDMDSYLTTTGTPRSGMIPPDRMEQADAKAMEEVGVYVDGTDRSGTYILRDFHPLCLMAQSDEIELLPIADALKKYDWLSKKYYWKAVRADMDEYTARCASTSEPQGYFVRVKKGVKVSFPVQVCLYISQGNIAQTVHNIIIIEESAELHLIAGCATGHSVSRAVHLGVSEHYIGRGAKLTSTMVHSWGSEVEVRPRSGTIVEEGGTVVSNYFSLRPARSVQTNPRTWLNGANASAKYLTIILGSHGSSIDIGGDVYLNGENTSAELAHRAVCTGGRIYQRGLLVGNAPCQAHVDCAGMMLDAGEDGFIEAVPGLRALHSEARMSHEASIGKIAPEQVAYLQSRGMEEREAISLIIRGFLDAGIESIGSELDARIAEIARLAGHGEK